MVAPQICGDADRNDSTWKIVKRKRCIKEEKKSNFDKNFSPLKMMKTSTPTTKNNTKNDSGSRSSKSNNTNKTPTRKPSIKLFWVTPDVDKIEIVQVPTIFDKNDEDDMSTVSSSSNEQGYFSSSSKDLESVQQEVQNNVNESVLSIKQLREQKRRKEEEEISRIIAKIQGEHISSLPESQQIKNKTHTQIKQEHDYIYEVPYSTRASSGTKNH